MLLSFRPTMWHKGINQEFINLQFKIKFGLLDASLMIVIKMIIIMENVITNYGGDRCHVYD
jgi:hypothetical protein